MIPPNTYKAIAEATDKAAVFDTAMDHFSSLNDSALLQTAQLHDRVNILLQNGSPYRRELTSQFDTLFSTLEDMTDFALGLQRYGKVEKGESLHGTRTAVHDQLAQPLRHLDSLFRCGYHQPAPAYFDYKLQQVNTLFHKPYWHFNNILSGNSKPAVTGDTIETVEEYIRYVHEYAIEGFNRLILDLSKKSNEGTSARRKPSEYTTKVTYIGNNPSFETSPMAPVAQAVSEFEEDVDYLRLRFSHASISDRGFAAHAPMGYHQVFLKVMYDQAVNNYFFRMTLNEPAYGRGRIEFYSELMPLMGFKHTVDHWTHWATKRVATEDVDVTMKFLLSVIENSKDMDISGSDVSPQGFVNHFTSLYRYRMRKRGHMHQNMSEYAQRRSRKQSWTPREEQILELLVNDSHPLQTHKLVFADRWKTPHLQYYYSPLDIQPEVAHFLSAHAHELFPDGARTGEVKEAYRATFKILFSCFDVNYRKWNEEKESFESVPCPKPLLGSRKAWKRRVDKSFRNMFDRRIAQQVECYQQEGYRILPYRVGDIIPPELITDALVSLQGHPLCIDWRVQF